MPCSRASRSLHSSSSPSIARPDERRALRQLGCADAGRVRRRRSRAAASRRARATPPRSSRCGPVSAASAAACATPSIASACHCSSRASASIDRLGPDGVADAPRGHRERLREAAQHERPPAQLRDATPGETMLEAVVEEAEVRLVAEQQRSRCRASAAAIASRSCRAEDVAGRVDRRVHDRERRLAVDRRRELVPVVGDARSCPPAAVDEPAGRRTTARA